MSAPLPFMGQKRMFAKHFIEVIRQYPADRVFVDLFGGSGLLSHLVKHHHPESRVIYNDFDNYRQRIENIPPHQPPARADTAHSRRGRPSQADNR